MLQRFATRRAVVCTVLLVCGLASPPLVQAQHEEPEPGPEAGTLPTAELPGSTALQESVGPTPLTIPPSPIGYDIEVVLDPETRELQGREIVTWTNTLDEPVSVLPMHLYLNAFSHDESTWNRSTLDARFQLETVLQRFDDPWGWTEPRTIRQNGIELEWNPISPDDGNGLDRSLIEVRLAEPVAPGAVVTLDIDWEGRLPAAAARTGGYDRFFFVAQWFPKIAGIRPDGTFNRHQFHGPTEFFADFADFDVRMKIPRGWGVAATGRGVKESTEDGADWYRYRQSAVHDFAFATGADMVDAVLNHTLPAGGEVEVHIFQPKALGHQVERWQTIVGACLDVMSSRVAPYPYDTLTVVLPPRAGLRSVGMEYPTLFTGLPGGAIWDGSLLGSTRINELTIAHEFAHQYFYGIVATNEFEDAFMDEGMTEYWGAEILIDTFGDAGTLFGRSISVSESQLSARNSRALQPPIWSGPSFLIRGFSIGPQFYSRPAATFQTAAQRFGREAMDAVFSAYVQRWGFRHPRIEDFWDVALDVGGTEVAAMLREAFVQTAVPDYRVTAVDSNEYAPPYGRFWASEGSVTVDQDWEGDSLIGLDPSAWEEDRTITVEILDPGHTRQSRTLGRIERRKIVPVSGAIDADYGASDETFYVSTARIEGPGWDHLPVDVELRFADGAVAVDHWDGKALFREYRVVRGAPLDAVLIDPGYKIRLDSVPANNGLSRKPSHDLARDWSWWMGGVFQWLVEGATSWL